ncbi:21456_t:CDS:2 [Entrophospora sp. SA101]|nr:21456_t:CDS:2 [Entrophospora sp. SA101]
MELFECTKKICTKTKDIRKLTACMHVFCGMTTLSGSVKNRALFQLLSLLIHPFPKIRRSTADQLYLTITSAAENEESEQMLQIEDILTNTDWNDSIPEIKKTLFMISVLTENIIVAVLKIYKNKLTIRSAEQIEHGAIEILASLIIESISPTDLQCIVLIEPPAILKNQKSKVIKLLSKIKADNLIKILPVKLFKNTLDFSHKLIEHSLNYNDSFKFIFGETKLLENSNFPGHFPAPASN